MDKEEAVVTGAAPSGFYDHKQEKEPREPMSRNTKMAIGAACGVALLIGLAVVIAAPWQEEPGPFVCKKSTVKADIVFITDGSRNGATLATQREIISNFSEVLNIGPANTRVSVYEMSEGTLNPTLHLVDTTNKADFQAAMSTSTFKGGKTDMAGAVTFAQEEFQSSPRDADLRYVIFFAAGPASLPICFNETIHDGSTVCTNQNAPNANCVLADVGVFDNGNAGCVNEFFPLLGRFAGMKAVEYLKGNVSTNFWFLGVNGFFDLDHIGNTSDTSTGVFTANDFSANVDSVGAEPLIEELNSQCG